VRSSWNFSQYFDSWSVTFSSLSSSLCCSQRPASRMGHQYICSTLSVCYALTFVCIGLCGFIVLRKTNNTKIMRTNAQKIRLATQARDILPAIVICIFGNPKTGCNRRTCSRAYRVQVSVQTSRLPWP